METAAHPRTLFKRRSVGTMLGDSTSFSSAGAGVVRTFRWWTSALIDLATGSLQLPTVSLPVTPTLTHDEFIRNSTEHAVLIDNATWISYTLPQQSLANTQFAVVLCFTNDRVESIELSHVFPNRDESWSNWSKEAELERKAIHDKWLVGRGLTQDTYDWGSVYSEFDAKSGASVIIFRYG